MENYLSLEERIIAAVQAFHLGNFTTKKSCAAHYRVSYKRFLSRLSGRPSRRDKKISNRRLDDDEEQVIIDFIKKLENAGIHGTSKTIETCANYLIKTRHRAVGAETPPNVAKSG